MPTESYRSTTKGNNCLSKDLWDKYTADKSDENRNALVVYYMPFLEQVAETLRKGNRSPLRVSKAELCSAGVLGAIAAMKKYNPSQGPFKNYAYMAIKWAMLKEVTRLTGRTKNHERQPEIGELITSLRRGVGGDGREFENISYTEDVSANLQREQLVELLSDNMHLLSQYELTFVGLFYINGHTRSECCELMNVSRQRIQQYNESIIAKLREACGHEGEFST